MNRARFQAERRAVLMASLAVAGVFWTAFGVLGCAVALRDRLLEATGGSLLAASALGGAAYAGIGLAVLGPMAWLAGSVHPRAWGLAPAGWTGQPVRRALFLILAGSVLGVLSTAVAARRPGFAWLGLTAAIWLASAWMLRRSPKAIGLAAFVSAGLGVVGGGLLKSASKRGTWGVTGPEDPAAWPLLLVTLGVVALPFVPAVLAVCRGEALREDARNLSKGMDPEAFLERLRREAEARLEEEAPPGWARRWMSASAPLESRIALGESWKRKKEGQR